MRPSSENVRLLNGSPMLVIPALPSPGLNSAVFRRAVAFRIAALRAGVSSRSPTGAAKTRLRTPPCSEANSDLIRSVAFCVSDPGIENSSFREPPIVATRTIRIAMIPIQLKTTRHGCAAQARIQRARAPVARRSCAASRSVVASSPGSFSLLRPFPARSVISFALLARCLLA